MIDTATGELAPLYGQASVACGNRRETVCPACSATYKRDARQLVRAGLAGGKGIPETITAHPCVFATLTAPSFGPVHSRRMRGKTVLPCRPRRDAKARRCPHGRDISCPTRHLEADPRLGQPMCGDCYDYQAAVLFNACAADLWRRFTTYLPRQLARRQGITQKTSTPWPGSGSSRSPNTRHAASSTSTPSSAWTPPARTTSPRPPASPPRRCATPSAWPPLPPLSSSSTRTRPSGSASARRPTPGSSATARPARHRPGAQRRRRRQLHRQVRHQDPHRPRPALLPDPQRRRHRAPALPGALPAADHHRLAARHPVPGLGAHARLRRPLPTKSRRYSVTFGQLRAARTDHRRAARPPDADRDAWGRPLDETVVLVLPVIWTYEGIGRPLAADAELALAAAARAREHHGQADNAA